MNPKHGLSVGTEEGALPAPIDSSPLIGTVVHLHAGDRIRIDASLFAAFEAASSPHSLRALRSDLAALDA